MLQGVGPRLRAAAATGRGASAGALLAITATALALVAFFDLQTSLPLLDEYAHRWTIQQLVAGHGFQNVGTSPQLVQVLVALPLAVLKTDPATWRLTELPFILMQGVFCALTADELGAGRFWSLVAGAAVICNPLNLAVSTGMMTETVFLGLFAGAIWSSLRWIDRGRSRWACVLLTALAVAQRPQAAAVVAAVIVGLLVFSRRKRSLRQDLPPVVALVLFSAAAYKLPAMLREASPNLSGPSGGSFGEPLPSYSGPALYVYVLANFPALLGLAAVPFLVGAWSSPRPTRHGVERPRAGRWWILPTSLALLAVAFAGLYVMQAPGHSIFVGNMVSGSGIGAALLAGTKVSPFPGPVFLGVVLLSAATYIVLLVKRRDPWTPEQLGAPGQILILYAALEMIAIVAHGILFDRYYLAAILPLVPLVAAAAAKSPPSSWGPAWAVMATAGAVGLYAVGTQDFIAWQVARHDAARIAYAEAPVDQVDSGFEEVAQRVWLPADEDPTGTLPRSVVARPSLRLVFAPPDDPRPGVSYRSLGSGRVVIERRP